MDDILGFFGGKIMDETIAAIATALGEGGIGIVRLSGIEALNVAERVFIPKITKQVAKLPGYSVHYGKVFNGTSFIDEALLIAMRAPHSYTGEDVAEIHCHGGIQAVRQVLHAVLQAGARLAEPGEFTKRAFLNGRVDLSQAEAVIEIIRAKTDKAMALAVTRLNGKLRAQVSAVRYKVLTIVAHIEAMIDFPEDDVEELTYEKLLLMTNDALADVKGLIKQSGQGKIYQEGIKAAIIGKPNVGKSSLLNALVGENKAIVTHIPGTTRDIIEEWLNIDGIPVKIVDTAGIREAEDIIEQLGVEKSLQVMREADIVLFVIDVETGLTESDRTYLEAIPRDEVIILVNKLDISEIKANILVEELNGYVVAAISAKEELGLKELADKLKIMLTGGNFDLGEQAVGNIRHLHAFEKTESYLLDVISAATTGLGYDFMAIDLRAAWESLGEITGETIGDDIVSQIFANFCIGK